MKTFAAREHPTKTAPRRAAHRAAARPAATAQRAQIRQILGGPRLQQKQAEHRPAEGQALDGATHAFLAGSFGRRFDGVRVAQQAAPSSPAPLAAAEGNRIRIAPGLDRAPAPVYRGVLAHEAAHVAQWQRGREGGAPWSEASLEAEARKAGIDAARGAAPTVRGIAADARPRFHPIYISTHGTQAYLDSARDFYTRWGYGTPEDVGSIEEIFTHMAESAGSIPRMTIVSHAVPDNINISFLRGGPGFVALSDWDITTEEALPQYSGHATQEVLVDNVMRDVQADPANAPLLDRLDLDLADPKIRQFIWWIIDTDYVTRVTPGNAIPQRATVVARAQGYADFYEEQYRDWLRFLVGLHISGIAEADADLLEQAIQAVVSTYAWDPIDRATGRAISEQIRSGREPAVGRVLAEGTSPPEFSPFPLDLMWASLRLGSDAVIEIKGCRIGQNAAYLRAISRFFSALGNTGPRVTAPDMFQVFGTLGYQAYPDNERRLRALWRNRGVRRAFLFWARELGWPLSDPPVADDLVAALRAGHAFPVGTVLYLIQGLAPANAIEWFSRHGYALTRAPDIEAAFFQGRNLRQAMGYTVVEWLQENRPGQRPGQIILPPDPAYATHIQEAQYIAPP